MRPMVFAVTLDRLLAAAIVSSWIACSGPKAAPSQPPATSPGSDGSALGSARVHVDGGSVTTLSCASMEETARLAGFIAAHAIWSVADGETLVTMVGSEGADGQRKLDRLVTQPIEQSVTLGREQLLKNPQHVARAALAFDGYITLTDGKTDAVFIEARAYGNGDAMPFEIAVPYRNAKSAAGFAVYRPKLLKVPPDLKNCDSLLNAFWAGVDSHAKAAEVWNAHIDQSR